MRIGVKMEEDDESIFNKVTIGLMGIERRVRGLSSLRSEKVVF